MSDKDSKHILASDWYKKLSATDQMLVANTTKIKSVEELIKTFGTPKKYDLEDTFYKMQSLSISNNNNTYRAYDKSLWDKEYLYDRNSTKQTLHSRSESFEITTDDGSLEVLSRADLLKYISERKLVQTNEAVRKMYERYQVAVKLVRSDDDGDTGV